MTTKDFTPEEASAIVEHFRQWTAQGRTVGLPGLTMLIEAHDTITAEHERTQTQLNDVIDELLDEAHDTIVRQPQTESATWPPPKPGTHEADLALLVERPFLSHRDDGESWLAQDWSEANQ